MYRVFGVLIAGALVMTLTPYLLEPNRPQRLPLAAAGLAVNVFLLMEIGEHMWHYSSTVPRIGQNQSHNEHI